MAEWRKLAAGAKRWTLSPDHGGTPDAAEVQDTAPGSLLLGATLFFFRRSGSPGRLGCQ